MLRLQKAPENEIDRVLLGADQVLISGNAAGAFSLLLDLYPTSENQELIRARLLELFSLVGEGDQDVLNARRRLASLMF